MNLGKLRRLYQTKKPEIEKTWQRRKQPKSDKEMLALLAACVLSSRAKWRSVERVVEKLKSSGMLFKGNLDDVKRQLKGISGRYVNVDRLAEYIVQARESFPFLSWLIKSVLGGQIRVTAEGVSPKDLAGLHQWEQLRNLLEKRGVSSEGLREMVAMLRGIGDKQASHFLASLGFEDYAILDVHVLDSLVKYGVIEEKPKYLSHKHYLFIEKKMKEFSQSIDIPFHHLDTLFWEEGSRVEE